MMRSILYKASVIALVATAVSLVDAGMRLWDEGHYGASVLGHSLAFASCFAAALLMDMFAKSKEVK